jgi:hypothetical protein
MIRAASSGIVCNAELDAPSRTTNEDAQTELLNNVANLRVDAVCGDLAIVPRNDDSVASGASTFVKMASALLSSGLSTFPTMCASHHA